MIPETTIDLLPLALDYARRGLSLLPCLSKNKKPDSRLLPRDKDGKPTRSFTSHTALEAPYGEFTHQSQVYAAGLF